MTANSDVHRNMLQIILQSGALPEKELLKYCRQCVEAHERSARKAGIKMTGDDAHDRETLDKILTIDLDASLDPLGLKIAKKRHRDGDVYYGIVNLRDDEAAKLASDLGKPQKEYARQLVLAINAASDKRLEGIEAENVRLKVSDAAKMNSSDTKACLDRLVAGGWIDRDQEDTYSLGVRAALQHMYMHDNSVQV